MEETLSCGAYNPNILWNPKFCYFVYEGALSLAIPKTIPIYNIPSTFSRLTSLPSSRLHIDLVRCVFPSLFPDKILYLFHSCPSSETSTDRFSSFYLLMLTTFGAKYKPCSPAYANLQALLYFPLIIHVKYFFHFTVCWQEIKNIQLFTSFQRFEDQIPVVARFSAPVQTGPWAHRASCTMGTGTFTG
jgi:hypothetical protein